MIQYSLKKRESFTFGDKSILSSLDVVPEKNKGEGKPSIFRSD